MKNDKAANHMHIHAQPADKRQFIAFLLLLKINENRAKVRDSIDNELNTCNHESPGNNMMPNILTPKYLWFRMPIGHRLFLLLAGIGVVAAATGSAFRVIHAENRTGEGIENSVSSEKEEFLACESLDLLLGSSEESIHSLSPGSSGDNEESGSESLAGRLDCLLGELDSSVILDIEAHCLEMSWSENDENSNAVSDFSSDAEDADLFDLIEETVELEEIGDSRDYPEETKGKTFDR